MEINQFNAKVFAVISDTISTKVAITDDTQLIGDNTSIDSMKLVEICLALEDLAEDMGFEFDWTSSKTMSTSKSMFRTIGSLIKEFHLQSESPS